MAEIENLEELFVVPRPEGILTGAIGCLESSLSRPADRYAWTDDGFFAILAGLAGRQDFPAPTRADAARNLARAALVMPHAKGNPNKLLQLRDMHPELNESIESVLLPAAEDGAQVALLVLSEVDSVHGLVRSAAEAALARVTSLPPSKAGEIGIGVSYGHEAWLIRTLDEGARLEAIQGLIAKAARTDDVLSNRESALAVVPSLAMTLSEAHRHAWASSGLTDIHHQGHRPGKDVHNGDHGAEEAPYPTVVHSGVQG